ncbi:MAG TPA: N-formylglutamate deformylase [Burkholderiaceae bacterium]|nr:N-formylglutamate deformylase [Burkholderiaceae bacterium]
MTADSALDPDVCTLVRGSTPLLVSVPHCGRAIPAAMTDAYLPRALAVEDTDWHLERLYAFATTLGASLLVPRHSRFVIDLNRPPDDAPMYPGANNTELCPTHFFTGDPLYVGGRAPDPAEIARRRERYWAPYHRALGAELERLRADHGHAVLFDAHSIKARLPWLFEGRLPALNLGTAAGTSCSTDLRDALAAVLAGQARHDHVVDGRFKGGYITRHYGRPAEHVHAVQLEMIWDCYMDEDAPWNFRPQRAAEIQPLLEALLVTMRDWRPDAARSSATGTPR